MAGASTPNAGHTVKFVGHDATGLPVKRKQVHQACLQCRKRKKRCRHVEDSISDAPGADEEQVPETGSEGRVRAAKHNSQRPVATADRDTSDAAAQLLRFFHHASDKASSNSPEDDQIQQPRPMSPAPPFLGDLNPEGILVEATMVPSQKSPPADDESGHQEIGFLPPTPRRESKDSPTQRQTTTCTGSPKLCEETSGPYFSVPREDGTRLTIHVQDTAKFAAIAQTLVTRGLADKVMPSDAEWKAMRDLYLTKIHPIFPIYEQSALMDLPKERALRELIQASVCLAAATDPETHHLLTFKSHVQGSMSNTVASFDDYSHDMASFINKRLAELQESRQIPLTNQIQVMALTCMYWQPSNPTERFEPLTLYAKLVSLVHTHGVHLGILARGPSECCIEGRGKRIFKCLYALDRLLGAISARPFMFHNVDLTQVPRPDDQDSPIFRLFISLILLLDQVVEMYRPRPKFNCVDIPVFERMAIEAGAQFEPEGLIVTLEVLYHAIGVLSVRMPRHRFRTAPECDTLQGTSTHHLPPSGMNARRSHSADRILDVIKDYKLSPMPFIPYASTLSLSVAYRKWRFSQLPVFRTRGGADFKKVLPIVQELGAIWTSARINGQLGQCVMLKLDRSEIMNRKRARETAAGPGTKRVRTDLLRGESGRELVSEQQNGAMERNPVEGDKINPVSAPSDGNTRSDATGSSRRPRDRPIHDPSAGSNDSAGLLTSVRDSVPSPVASSIMERPQQQNLSLTWTTSWTADKTHSNHNGNNSTILANPPSVTPIRDHNPNINSTQQQPVLAEGYSCIQPDDAIPLPRNALAAQPTELDDTSPLAGLSEGSMEDFLAADDDALFRSWDPRFAQSVDFSFSSILDPGNPFAWPEYCNYTT